jgi:hypothetical protein
VIFSLLSFLRRRIYVIEEEDTCHMRRRIHVIFSLLSFLVYSLS